MATGAKGHWNHSFARLWILQKVTKLLSILYLPGERYQEIAGLKDELVVEMRVIEAETDRLEVTWHWLVT